MSDGVIHTASNYDFSNLRSNRSWQGRRECYPQIGSNYGIVREPTTSSG
jgi:hypothetical protein